MRTYFAALIILIVAGIAWAILGTTIVARTDSSDGAQRAALAGLWGNEQTQSGATFSVNVPQWTPASRKNPGSFSLVAQDVEALQTGIDVDLDLDERLKGLLWYNTYTIDFRGTYRIDVPRNARGLFIALPIASGDGQNVGSGATYENFGIEVDGKPVHTTSDGDHLRGDFAGIRPGSQAMVTIAYRSHGIGTWRYSFQHTEVRNFTLTMTTNFANIDFPPQTISPTTETRRGSGWALVWQYRDLISAFGVGMAFPEHLQPGPIASRISFWAPLSLGFYFFVLLLICTMRKIGLQPMHYAFLAAAFFAFHLLFAYTVDRLPIGWAFAIASLVSMALTISYLRLVVGLRFAAVEAALAQFFYLVLFSYALFNEGWSGLSITIGSIVTLFVAMQWTAKLDWDAAFARRTHPAM